MNSKEEKALSAYARAGQLDKKTLKRRIEWASETREALEEITPCSGHYPHLRSRDPKSMEMAIETFGDNADMWVDYLELHPARFVALVRAALEEVIDTLERKSISAEQTHCSDAVVVTRSTIDLITSIARDIRDGGLDPLELWGRIVDEHSPWAYDEKTQEKLRGLLNI
tara:strand:- start:7528 stop:8034 length:507 start_codon:yes stop_codon:yes gene_type:complete